MRSTQKETRKLLSEVRKLIGCKTIAETWSRIEKVRKLCEIHLEKYGFNGVQLSPYRNNQWALSALGAGYKNGVKWLSMKTNAEEIIDEPLSMAKRFVQHFSS